MSDDSYMADGMESIVNEFLVESYENLDRLDQELIDLELNPSEQSLLASIFRTIHTIKGTCGFIGFSKLESVAHVGENLLSKLREAELSLSPEITSALLSMVDAIRQILSCIENDQNEGVVDYSSLVETLTCLQNGESVGIVPEKTPEPIQFAEEEPVEDAAPDTVEESEEPASDSSDQSSLYDRLGGEEAIDGVVNIFYAKILLDGRIKQFFEGIDIGRQIAKQKAFLTFVFGGPTPYEGKDLKEVHKPLVEKGLNDSHFDLIVKFLDEALQEMNVKPEMIKEVVTIAESVRPQVLSKDVAVTENAGTESVSKPKKQSKSPAIKQEASAETADAQGNVDRRQEKSVAESSIRVDVDILDKLMNLVGELVLARNQILQFSSADLDSTFVATTQHLNLVTTELQEGVMQTRMQPIGNIWSKFPRVVRDLAHSCGKKVRLEMEGKETELDKTLIEAIKDPLTHIVRNSVDHGLESPEERRERGKDEEGVLLLRAFHEGGQVNIEIKDDGGGIDPEKIKNKAIEKNLITLEQAAKMNDREIINLVFKPGFSTAAKVTNVSGRGVGMDVVRTNIEKIGGTVDIQSRLGEGTTLKVKIPLTLAIIPALTVIVGGGRYAIPQVNLLELVRLEGEQAKEKVEKIKGTPVYRLRGNILPLVSLNDELKVEKLNESDAVNIVVLQADDRQFGLVVEEIRDTEEIVVKPLGKQLQGINAFSGTTIMGDGKVALILDVMGLAQSAKVVTESGERSVKDNSGSGNDKNQDQQSFLIFGMGEDSRMAIPLQIVARLEEFKFSGVEQSGNQDVVQYRGEIMPLIYLSEVFSGIKPENQEILQAVVYTRKGRSVALVADKILDIVDEVITVKRETNRHGTLGTIVVQGRVTDLLDVEGIVRDADASFFEDREDVPLLAEG
jgi:two-component system chemotaxis sensor kinase CheA